MRTSRLPVSADRYRANKRTKYRDGHAQNGITQGFHHYLGCIATSFYSVWASRCRIWNSRLGQVATQMDAFGNSDYCPVGLDSNGVIVGESSSGSKHRAIR